MTVANRAGHIMIDLAIPGSLLDAAERNNVTVGEEIARRATAMGARYSELGRLIGASIDEAIERMLD